MKRYVSIDIETLGLNPKVHDVVEFGAVVDDLKTPVDKLPRFHCYVLPPEDRSYYRGDPKSMAMNAGIISTIANRSAKNAIYLTPNQVGLRFRNWLFEMGFDVHMYEDDVESVEIVVAGKNFGSFDWKFISRFHNFSNCIKIHRRLIDPMMLYFNPKKDSEPPNLDTCLKRAGIDKFVTHNAVEDALDVIRCLRHKWKIAL